jgi:hypothetical protein
MQKKITTLEFAFIVMRQFIQQEREKINTRLRELDLIELGLEHECTFIYIHVH